MASKTQTCSPDYYQGTQVKLMMSNRDASIWNISVYFKPHSICERIAFAYVLRFLVFDDDDEEHDSFRVKRKSVRARDCQQWCIVSSS